ncbi:MarR family winged helix-turn-helix transcriptional regulator [Nonomuraea sp. NPDC059194]|uniref:MarR family winged helix-turn-helix transcriptional regulator n=1 Tax=Nonomuraea sp. NPDC059194 TaxID=3346764 RepID=UPI0036C9B3B9
MAHWTNSKPSRISHAVNKLEQSGWVRRKHYKGDRRGWLAVLTDEGLAALQAATPHHVESARAHLIDLYISQVLLDHLTAEE